jgi:hypothetical protein
MQYQNILFAEHGHHNLTSAATIMVLNTCYSSISELLDLYFHWGLKLTTIMAKISKII